MMILMTMMIRNIVLKFWLVLFLVLSFISRNRLGKIRLHRARAVRIRMTYTSGLEKIPDESGTVAIKTVELDVVLGGRVVQHKELQGHKSNNYLSYFKPCIIPIEEGFASGLKKPEEEVFETRLYICKGKRVVKLKQAYLNSTNEHAT